MPAADLQTPFFSLMSKMLNVPVASLSLASTRETLDAWDSLKHLHLMLALEEEFNIEFDDDEMSSLNVVKDLLAAVEAKVGS